MSAVDQIFLVVVLFPRVSLRLNQPQKERSSINTSATYADAFGGDDAESEREGDINPPPVKKPKVVEVSIRRVKSFPVSCFWPSVRPGYGVCVCIRAR